MIRLRQKIAAGARFIQTQAVYDIGRFEAWMKEVRRLGLHEKAYIQAGILVNKSVKSIEMTRKVSGMQIPDDIVERMRNSDDAEREGVLISLELIDKIRKIEGVRGIHIMAVGWESIVPSIVKEAGLSAD